MRNTTQPNPPFNLLFALEDFQHLLDCNSAICELYDGIFAHIYQETQNEEKANSLMQRLSVVHSVFDAHLNSEFSKLLSNAYEQGEGGK